MSSYTHKKALVRLMLDKGETTACKIPFSNANQYFCELEKEGFCQSRWGNFGTARVKFRFIPASKINKAKKHFGLENYTKKDDANHLIVSNYHSTTKKQLLRA